MKYNDLYISTKDEDIPTIANVVQDDDYRLRNTIRAVIESCFSETKEEIQLAALNIIMELIGEE